MKVKLSPKSEKAIKRLNNPIKGRILKALERLSHEPPEGDIKNLIGRDGFRVRIGGYRILFDIVDNTIVVHDVLPRGQAYKGGN